MSSTRPLSLHDIISILEDEDTECPDLGTDIFISPPDNANAELTDEDSGDEDYVNINNLPPSFLRTSVEIHSISNAEETNDESVSSEPLRKVSKQYHWRKQTYCTKETTWKSATSVFYERSPLQWFSMFFTEEVYELLTTETNRYLARKNITADIKVEKIKCVVGILLVSGYCIVSRRRMYWENSSDSRNDLIASAMSRDRFSLIFYNLHCADNRNLDPSDKFAKLRPLMNNLAAKFLEHSPHKENHSVDEAMVPYYGRHGCKQFIRGKPIRYGYKLWVGATSGGYIVWFEPYQGASTNLDSRYVELGLGASVVLTYTDKLQKLGMGNDYHLFIDNFFTGLPLINELSKRNIRVTGTIRENRSGRCPLLDNKTMKKKERGFADYRVSDDIIICKWHDNSMVSVCSNAIGMEPIHRTDRYSQKLKRKITVSQPHLIYQYNKNMGGVDRSDQNISAYRISIRGKKWYMPLMLHCIDMAVQNAWLLCKENGGSFDLLTFRRRIAVAIIEGNKTRQKPGPSRPSSVQLDARHDGKDHFVIEQKSRTRCALCHTLCPSRCIKCDVGLHVRCFLAYHSKN